jgi:hypothetical protein
MDKPEALRLAERLDADATSGDMGRKPDPKCHKRKAAAELRRLHEMNRLMHLEFNNAIDFAIQEGCGGAVFLRCWREGDTSDWPEFQSRIYQTTGEQK